MDKREESIIWWKNLPETTKKFLMEKHIPYKNYITNSDIELIFNFYSELKNQEISF